MEISPAQPIVQAGELPEQPPTTASSNHAPILPLEIAEENTVTRTKTRLYLILAAFYLSLFLAALDTTIVAQSIPTICADLHSAAGYVWIGGAYLLANATSGPIWSSISSVFGRKPVLLIAVTLFAISSIIAALAHNMPMLIAGRGLQGAAGGGLVQLSIITISDLFSVRERSVYLGFSGFVWALAGSAGPLIGGAFTESATWRWCFWINVPICVVTFGLMTVFLDVHNPRTKLSEGLRAIDWLGTFSILAISLLILLGLDFGGTIAPWNSPKVICLVVFGAAMIGVFILTEQRVRYPMMPLAVFKSWSNDAVFAVVVAHAMVLIGIEYYMPLYFQSVLQASPIRSGVLLLPLIIVQAVGELVAGYTIHLTGRYREFMWIGSLFLPLGSGLYILFGPDTSVAMLVGLLIIGALGPGLLFQAPMAAIQNSVSQADTAAATAALIFLRNIAMSLSVVVGGVVFQNSMDTQQTSLAAAGLSESVLEALSGSQAAANVGIPKIIEDPQQRRAVLEAFSWSLRNIFILYTGLSVVCTVASFFIKHQNLRTEHTETKTGIQHLSKNEKS
ncbi:hypothetical protein PFICI_03181 [Pestalotiopsis fici W106-1]|uniref:Major facilitator superfamily (MFS) profile domain-containing protein n=1 Tax=Pestalotiopsis fici (strain W106-1 / CGMCC3.15140) TaxID=1229662 RepID=W3XIV3_PESFW|nr:uncharacterized protein PFICI_03181 [Pestalotiopsis fici W106-1]ETS85156.1 hypothetical protein PFICI_03181 [Pestalotiopsis fici W106-1]